MKALVVILSLLCVYQLNAQKGLLIAEKGKRQMSFVEGKRYTFTYAKEEALLTQKGVLTILNDTVLQIKGKNQTVDIPLSKLHGVYHYRHWSSVVFSVLQSGLGATLAGVAFSQSSIDWLDVLYGVIGVAYFTDGIFSLTGTQTIGVLGPNPSTTRRFTFRIQQR